MCICHRYLYLQKECIKIRSTAVKIASGRNKRDVNIALDHDILIKN